MSNKTKKIPLLIRKMFVRAIKDSFIKLNPKTQAEKSGHVSGVIFPRS